MYSTAQQIADTIDKKHAFQLEIFAAAFLKEVGSEKATDYVLAECHSGDTWTWRFIHKDQIVDHGFVCTKCGEKPE